ncbi:hypothetical protein K469DRAFT_694019 [Zopfia rhizophila CBS 207.26]|uniref:Uncharacterized protein n=1 Tax=Zopfia rhizophila CBS 207.26 TaxID=1314779 RepID=A0A6A6DJ67_9PEZI|nr:hypothetical protein K469DRAFT_694019 [Zopfia rhizophila CBS 207.26]
MPHDHEIDPPTRAAIITLKFEGHGWTYISEKVATCSPSGVKRFFERVLTRANCDPNNLDLPLLLQYLEDETNRGRQERFSEGSAVQEKLVQMTTLDVEHEDMPHRRIIDIVERQENERIPYSTGKKVLKESEVVKRVPPQKIELDAAHRQYQIIFCNWALGRLQLGAIFIFSDEMAVENDHHRKRAKVSMLKGGNEVESEAETRILQEVMNINNQRHAAIQNMEREITEVPRTYENGVLQEINANNQERDRIDPLPSGRRRRRRLPQWEFKYEETRDNAGAHIKAKRLSVEKRQELGCINVIDWPP